MTRGILYFACAIIFSSCCCTAPRYKPKAASSKANPSGKKCVTDWKLEKSALTMGGREVYVTPTNGSPVLLLHELPGMTPAALDLAEQLAASEAGYRVYVPLMFGKFGEWSGANFIRVLCSKDWEPFRKDTSHPIAEDIAKLCVEIDQANGGDGLAVIGNCLSGGIAVELLELPQIRGAVASQTATPFIFKRLSPLYSKRYRRALSVHPDKLERARARTVSSPEVNLLAFRYSEDKLSPPDKLLRMSELFGDSFTGYVLSSHSVFEGASLPNIHQIEIGGGDDGHSVLTAAPTGREECGCEPPPGQAEARAILLGFLEHTFASS